MSHIKMKRKKVLVGYLSEIQITGHPVLLFSKSGNLKFEACGVQKGS